MKFKDLKQQKHCLFYLFCLTSNVKKSTDIKMSRPAGLDATPASKAAEPLRSSFRVIHRPPRPLKFRPSDKWTKLRILLSPGRLPTPPFSIDSHSFISVH